MSCTICTLNCFGRRENPNVISNESVKVVSDLKYVHVFPTNSLFSTSLILIMLVKTLSKEKK